MSKGAALLRSGVGAARYRLTGHRMPLSVNLFITARCNALCGYCSLPMRPARELGTTELISLVDAMARAGAVRVGISGGEPLVRDDLGIVVDRLAEHGIWSTIETNGYRYPERADELARVGRLMIAFDGGQAAHDDNREPGAWHKAVRAIDHARSRGVDVHTVTTLTARNLGEIDTVLDHAERWGVTANFQLLQRSPFLADARADALAPEDASLRKALRWLLEARLAGRPVGTSEKYLRFLLTWKDYTQGTADVPHEDLHCLAGQLHCAVMPDGSVSACGLSKEKGTPSGAAGFAAAFERLRDNACRACTSTALSEYNYLYNLNAPTLLEWTKSLRRSPDPGSGAPRRGVP